jgi:tetratricopeptide (TPR) repeat protein
LALVRRATDNDPLSLLAWAFMGGVLHRAGRDAEARAAFARALQINPNAGVTRLLLGETELDHGNARAALEHYHHAGPGHSQYGIAMAEHSLGHAAESLAALDELKEKFAAGFAFQIAQVHAWRGETDAAFEWLDRAYAQHDSGLLRIWRDARVKSLHGDPRYAALLRRLNYPEE